MIVVHAGLGLVPDAAIERERLAVIGIAAPYTVPLRAASGPAPSRRRALREHDGRGHGQEKQSESHEYSSALNCKAGIQTLRKSVTDG